MWIFKCSNLKGLLSCESFPTGIGLTKSWKSILFNKCKTFGCNVQQLVAGLSTNVSSYKDFYGPEFKLLHFKIINIHPRKFWVVVKLNLSGLMRLKLWFVDDCDYQIPLLVLLCIPEVQWHLLQIISNWFFTFGKYSDALMLILQVKISNFIVKAFQ